METKNKMTTEQLEDAARLKALYESKKKSLGITQYTIADDLNISQGAVGHYLNGRNPLNVPIASGFARVLHVSIADFSPSLAKELARYTSQWPEVLNDEHGNKFKRAYEYPLFSAAQAGEISEIKTYRVDDALGWVSSTRKASKHSFWIEVRGHSMTAPHGVKPSFPEGMYILIDPEEDVLQGDFCIASINRGSDITFKKFDRDAGVNYLVPLNPSYRTIDCDDKCRIIGKVVQAQWPEDTF